MINRIVFRDVIIASVIFFLCGFFNASMDITYHNFKSSVYSEIADEGTATYKYFQSHWTNKWEYQYEPWGIYINGELITWETRDGDGTPIWFILDDDGKRIPKYFLNIKFFLFKHPLFFDAWHLYKTLMIGLLIIYGMVLYYKPKRIVFQANKLQHWLGAIILFVWFSIVWNTFSFNLFYDTLLRL